MNEHFIKNIEIKNFKCFEDFKADGFGQVNLIGGKNNVGKTAFMEACYLSSNYASKIMEHPKFEYNYGAAGIEKEWMYFEIIKSLIIIQQNREQLDFITEWIKEEIQLVTYEDCEITLNDVHKIDMDGSSLNTEFKYHSWSSYEKSSINHFQKNKYFYKIYKKNNPPLIHNTSFTTPCNSNHYNLRDMIDTLKIENENESIEIILGTIFEISSIDIIKNKLMVKHEGTFKDLNYFGDGLKHFLHIILMLFVNKDKVIYLDEIENGIHYSNLDNLWKIILKISKDNNLQIFATTHSKECIESFNRVQQELKDKEGKNTYYFEMYKNIRKNNITMRKIDKEQLAYELQQGKGFRGE